MNLIAWPLALSLSVGLLIQAVTFHKATVCRQKAWLKSTELLTRDLLYKPAEKEMTAVLECMIQVNRSKRKVSWRRLPNLHPHQFQVELSGTF